MSASPPSLSPSETLRFRGAGAANASITSAAAGIAPAIPKGGSASIAAPSGILGGLLEQLELVLVEFRVVFQLGVNVVSHQVDQEFKVDT